MSSIFKHAEFCSNGAGRSASGSERARAAGRHCWPQRELHTSDPERPARLERQAIWRFALRSVGRGPMIS